MSYKDFSSKYLTPDTKKAKPAVVAVAAEPEIKAKPVDDPVAPAPANEK